MRLKIISDGYDGKRDQQMSTPVLATILVVLAMIFVGLVIDAADSNDRMLKARYEKCEYLGSRREAVRTIKIYMYDCDGVHYEEQRYYPARRKQQP